jgi:hypothetical protein
MKQLPRTMEPSHQQTLPFPAVNARVDLWNSLNEPHQQECRRVLREMLVVVVRQSRNALQPHAGRLSQDSEELPDD